VPIGHHNKQGISVGQTPAGMARGEDDAFNLIRGEIFARTARLIAAG